MIVPGPKPRTGNDTLVAVPDRRPRTADDLEPAIRSLGPGITRPLSRSMAVTTLSTLGAQLSFPVVLGAASGGGLIM